MNFEASLHCRKYFGHKPTIRPNAKKLYRLLLNQGNTSWEVFASRVRTYQRGFLGEPNEVRPGRGEFHENPSSCICEESGANAKTDQGSQKSGKESDAMRKDFDEDDQNMDDELEWMDPDDEDDPTGAQETGLASGSGLDDTVPGTEEPELEEMLSD